MVNVMEGRTKKGTVWFGYIESKFGLVFTIKRFCLDN